MPVRLKVAHQGQAINTTYYGDDGSALAAVGKADNFLELASDYEPQTTKITTATADTVSTATYYKMNSASAQTLTVRPSDRRIGTVITVIQEGAGAVTIAAGSGVTINTASTSLIMSGQYGVAQLIKTDTNTHIAFGSLGG